MSSREIKYNHSHLNHDKSPRLRSLWDSDSIMSWIDTQPNALESPEFYAPMAEHDPPQLTLLRDIRETLGEVWSLDHPFVHPLAVANFEQDDKKAADDADEAVLASFREMGVEDAT